MVLLLLAVVARAPAASAAPLGYTNATLPFNCKDVVHQFELLTMPANLTNATNTSWYVTGVNGTCPEPPQGGWEALSLVQPCEAVNVTEWAMNYTLFNVNGTWYEFFDGALGVNGTMVNMTNVTGCVASDAFATPPVFVPYPPVNATMFIANVTGGAFKVGGAPSAGVHS